MTVAPFTGPHQQGDVYKGISGLMFRVVREASYEEFHEAYPMYGDMYSFYYMVEPEINLNEIASKKLDKMYQTV